MSRGVAVFNAGSSSIKFALYDADHHDEPRRTAFGAIEGLPEASKIWTCEVATNRRTEHVWPKSASRGHEEYLYRLIEWIERHVGPDGLAGTGHRVVFGGASYVAPVRIDQEVLRDLESFISFMPLHLPHNLAPIKALHRLHPQLPHVACFDTAFHSTIPRLARLYAIPRELTRLGVMRYGFHGLSYEYVARRLRSIDARAAGGRTIVAHLGSGASLCAMSAGRSVDTTMGFSALDGLVMGTRPGSLDAGILLYLMRERGYGLEQLEHLLYEQCGLRGVSDMSGDMQTLLASDTASAREAIDLFCLRVVTSIGALAAPLGGLDALVFTGGIGEHAAPIRRRICGALAWLGVRVDADANVKNARRISTQDSRVDAWIVPTDEDEVIARHTLALLQ
jgi:acetate kinase